MLGILGCIGPDISEYVFFVFAALAVAIGVVLAFRWFRVPGFHRPDRRARDDRATGTPVATTPAADASPPSS